MRKGRQGEQRLEKGGQTRQGGKIMGGEKRKKGGSHLEIVKKSTVPGVAQK